MMTDSRFVELMRNLHDINKEMLMDEDDNTTLQLTCNVLCALLGTLSKCSKDGSLDMLVDLSNHLAVWVARQKSLDGLATYGRLAAEMN